MYKLVLFLLLTFSLHAQDDVRLTAEAEPLTTICGCVNAISGDFFFGRTDVAMLGSEPLDYTMLYDSGLDFDGAKGYSMGSQYPFYMRYVTLDPKTKIATMKVMEREGFYVPYRRKMENGLASFTADPTLFASGFTNYSEGGISAQTNIRNHLIKHSPDNNMHVIDGSGTKRIYHPYQKYNYQADGEVTNWHLREETRPNGHKVCVDYEKPGFPKRISTRNSDQSKTYNWMEFDYSDVHYAITASNGQQVRYDLKQIKTKGKVVIPHLVQINSTHGIPVSFEIDTTPKIGLLRQTTRISKPDNRYLKISYSKGDKPGKGDKGQAGGKVLSLRAPAGPNNSEISIARFNYPDKETTEFWNAQGTKTTYRSKAKRIVSIDNHDKNGHLYYSQKFLWSDSKANRGALLAKGRSNAHNRFLTTSTITYDDRGNILKENLYGNLTGNVPETFTVDVELRPTSPTECYTTEFIYSTDGFNLPLVETHPNGKRVEFTYLPGTNLCSSRLIYNGNSVLAREFHLYDDGFLTCTIVDDGSGTNANDLTNVHTRTFTRIARRNESPALGYPETIIESYLDLATNTETQLKKVHKHYNSFEQLIQEDVYDAYDTLAYSQSYIYDQKGNLTCSTDPIGRVTNYSWDANKNKVVEEVQGSNVGTVYHYDCCNRLIKECEYHADTSILVTEHTYDAVGNRISTRDHFENVTRFEYDEFGRQTKIIHPKCLTSDGRAFHPTVQYQYDIVGNVIAETDGLGNSTKTTYNIRGQPTSISYPDGSLERFDYNLDGTLAKKWEKSGLLCQYSYDGLQRLTQTAYYDTDGTLLRTTHNIYTGALLTQTIDAMGNVTEYRYDGAGRKIEEIQSESRTTYGYDSLGRQNTITRWLDEYRYTQEVQEFDALDRGVECRVQDETGKIFRKERYAYDIRGNKTLTETFIDEETSSITEIRYDTRNKPVWIQDALGNVTTIHNFERHPNPFGGYLFSKTTTDPLGNQTIEVYDPLGRLSTTEKRNTSNQRLSYQSIFYDPAGNKELQQEVIYASGIVRGFYSVDWTYDSMGNPLVTTESGSDGSRKVTKNTYDYCGRLQTITKPDGITLNHTYDSLGRLKALSSSDNTISYTYEYDLNDNLLFSRDNLANTSTQRSYDPQNRLVQETLANGLTLAYAYDGLGRVANVKLPNSTGIHYTYHGVHLCQVSRLDSSSNPLYAHTYGAYDLRGLEQEQTLIGNAGRVELTYDALGRPLSKLTPHFTQVTSEDGFDAVGNLLSTTTTDAHGTEVFSYAYDDLYQLIGESGGTPHTYAYDSISNRLAKDDQAYTVNGLNQITSASRIAYAYDPSGNLTAKTTPDSSVRYYYDALNRMIRAEGPHGTVNYTYDSFGRRISEIHGSDTTHYLYQGQCEIGAYFNGDLRELRILGKGKGAELGAAIAIEIADKVYAPIHDHRGNICCLVDRYTCQPEQYYRYTAFGETIFFGNVQNPWQYASKRFDEWTGFHRFGKRDYDCRLGRWLTPDPAGFADGPNLYAYVHNRPMTLFDPWGLQGQDLYDRNKAGVSVGIRRSSPGTNPHNQSSNTIGTRPGCWSSGTNASCNPWLSGIKGAAHGCSDCILDTGLFFSSCLCEVGCNDFDLDCYERAELRNVIADQQATRKAKFDEWMQTTLNVNPNDAVYQASRGYMTTGIAIASAVTGVYGVGKLAWSIGRRGIIKMPSMVLSAKQCGRSNGFLGHKGFELKPTSFQKTRNMPEQINGRMFSGHALDQMQNRGLMPSIVEDVIVTGTKSSNKVAGRTQHYDPVNNVTVITEDNSVVTVFYRRE